MSYFTERHNLRQPVETTDSMSYEMYWVLYDLCSGYFDNIAWRFPEECPDGRGCCGLDLKRLSTSIAFEIPSLFRDQSGLVGKPDKYRDDVYDQYALLDFIEFIYDYCRDIKAREWHTFYHHNDLSFGETNFSAKRFRTGINDLFVKTGLNYFLNEDGKIERKTVYSVLSIVGISDLLSVPEKGLRELLDEAISLYKSPEPGSLNNAVEKIWAAFERMKTFYADLDKKNSITKILKNMSGENKDFYELFNNEFDSLTKIGNNFRIRHHETNKVDISDSRYYEYFFNRCLSIISITIKYLSE